MSDFEGKSYVELRKKIVKDEMRKLAEEKYITPQEMVHIIHSHEQFYLDQQTSNIKQREFIPSEPKTLQKSIEKPKIKDWYQSFILILGVILVLTSGILFATTTWNHLFKSNFIKITYLSLGSILFYIASILAERVYKIKKTGFAFWVLGSLYLPILVLSIGYFELFGSKLSLSGEYKFLLGFYGAIFCIPVYFYSAKKYNNSFFGWLTYLFLSSSFVFIGLQMKEEFNVFLLSLGIINLGIVLIGNRISFKKVTIFYAELQTYLLNVLLIISFFLPPNDIKIIFYGLMIISNLYLSYVKQNKLLGFLTFPILIFISNQTILLYTNYLSNSRGYLSILFITTLISFIGLYVLNNYKYLISSKYGTLYTTLIAFLYLFTSTLDKQYYILDSLFMFLVAILMYLVYKKEKSYIIKHISIVCIYLLQLGSGMLMYDYFSRLLDTPIYHLGIHASIVLFILFIEMIFIHQKNRFMGNIFYLLTNIYGVILFITNEIAQFSSSNNFMIFYLIIIIINCYFIIKPTQITYFINHLKTEFISIQMVRVLYLYGSFITVTSAIYHIIQIFSLEGLYYNGFVYVSIISLFLYLVMTKEWKKYLFGYFIASSLIGFLISFIMISYLHGEFYLYNRMIGFYQGSIKDNLSYLITQYVYIVILLIGLIVISHGMKIYHFLVMGLFFITIATNYLFRSLLLYNNQASYVVSMENGTLTLVHGLFSLLLFITSLGLFRKAIDIKQKDGIHYQLDYYLLFIFVNLVIAFLNTNTLWIQFGLDLLVMAIIITQLKRVNDKTLVYSLGSYYLLVPYYRFMTEVVKIHHLIDKEIIYIPIMIITAILIKVLWKKHYQYAQFFEWIVLTVCLFILLLDVFDDYLMDAIIFGITSVGMVVYGFYGKIKAHFFLGGIYLLILVTFETDKLARDTDSSLPWYTYLLIAGFLLIGIGSFYELQNKEGRKKIKLFKSIVTLFKKWK